jgi:hypothetical protein
VELVNNQAKEIRSQKLRYKAIQSFLILETSLLKEHGHNIFIRLDHGKDLRDELIVPSMGGEGPPTILQDLRNKPLDLTLPDVRFQTKAKDEVGGQSKGLQIRCRISQGRYEAMRPGDANYLRSLDVLIRRNASARPKVNNEDDSEDNTHSLYGLNKNFLNTTGESLENQLPTLDTVARGPLDRVETIKVDISHKGELSETWDLPSG